MEAALNNFAKISGDNKIVFIGDMAELGEESDAEHKRIISILGKNKFDRIILVGKNFGQFSKEIAAINFDDSSLAAEWLKKNPVANASILIKGSRSTKMERIMEAL
jgi:UDP-N-acetylmuramoyl-tripeptide--D-alanyl-D-alanine ligase